MCTEYDASRSRNFHHNFKNLFTRIDRIGDSGTFPRKFPKFAVNGSHFMNNWRQRRHQLIKCIFGLHGDSRHPGIPLDPRLPGFASQICHYQLINKTSVRNNSAHILKPLAWTRSTRFVSSKRRECWLGRRLASYVTRSTILGVVTSAKYGVWTTWKTCIRNCSKQLVLQCTQCVFTSVSKIILDREIMFCTNILLMSVRVFFWA